MKALAIAIKQQDHQLLDLQPGEPGSDLGYRLRKAGTQRGKVVPLVQLASRTPRRDRE